jgi:hypothetical protein
MENIHIIIGAVALALINPLWSKYQIEKEKKTKKREGVKVGAFLLIFMVAYGIFAFWYAGIKIGLISLILFLIIHYAMEKIFKFDN